MPSMHRKRSSMVAGAGSTGGVLAVCIGKLKRFFTANRPGLFQKSKGEIRWQQQGERYGKRKRAYRDEDTPDRIAAGVGGCAEATPREREGPDARP